MPRRAGPLALLALVAVLFTACDLLPIDRPSNALLVTVEASGGMCVPGTCSTRYDVRRDGSVVRSDGVRQQIDAAAMRRIIAAVDAADWIAILARPFTGTCPTAYDGAELTYTFQTVRGAVTVASCTTQIDPEQEPFSTLEGALFGSRG